jgi:hypothetical protein
LKVLPVELPIPLVPVSAITVKTRTLTPLARRFMECDRDLAKPLAETNKR